MTEEELVVCIRQTRAYRESSISTPIMGEVNWSVSPGWFNIVEPGGHLLILKQDEVKLAEDGSLIHV